MFWGRPPLFCMCGKMENGGNSALSVQVYIQAYEGLHGFLGGENVAGKNRKRRRFNELTLNLRRFFGAGYESRTRHLLLGKQSLYRMS